MAALAKLDGPLRRYDVPVFSRPDRAEEENHNRIVKRRIVARFDLRPMQARNGRYQAQPKAVAGCLTTSFEPIEAFEYVSDLVARNSGPFIGDRNAGTGISLPDLHGHATRRAGMVR